MRVIDPRLINMAARHFYDLQGLRMALIALAWQSAAWAWLATHSEPRMYATLVVAAVALAGPIILVERYYRSFGRVIPRDSKSGGSSMASTILIATALPFALRAQFHLWKSFPSIVWLALAAFSIRIVWDCWPYRWHGLLVSAAMLYMSFGGIQALDDGFGWMASRAWAVTGAMVITGVLDHVLFVHTMGHARQVAAETP